MVRIASLNFVAALSLLSSPLSAVAVEQQVGIEIAVAPFLPVKTLVQNYAPLREYLQAKLNVPVTIISAPDYKTYYKHIEKQEYSIIITTANSAYLAWAESGYIPLLRPVVNTSPVLVIRIDQPDIQLNNLRGKTLAMSDATAIVSMQGLQMLSEAGLKPGQDVTIKNMQNHAVAVNHVITGEVDAAIVSDRAIQQMPASIRDKIKIVYTWDKVAAPGIVYLGSPNLPRKKLKQIKQAIREFAQHSAEGIKLMNDMGYGGLTPVGTEELRPLQPYGAMLKKAIASVP
jgi:phosphonate transport system substrate-binding protein